MITSVSSISRYEFVPPPTPNTVARPATLGACQVRLQLSMLLLPITTRANFCAMKLSSFVVFEQLNIPNARGPCRSVVSRNPLAVRSSASSQLAGRSVSPSRISGSVSLTYRPDLVLDFIGNTRSAWEGGRMRPSALYASEVRAQGGPSLAPSASLTSPLESNPR